MPNPKITANGSEIPVSSNLLTAGRSSDNDIAFPNDSNVSRYHAEIENRGGDYWLIDLGSSNGTTVNGVKVTGEIRLGNGDTVLLGGSSEFVFTDEDDKGKEKEEPAAAATTAPAASAEIPGGTPDISAPPIEQGTLIERETAVASKPSSTVLIAGGICGLAVICLVAAAVFYAMKGSKCDAHAVITKPEPGDTISQPVDIEVDAENTGCVASAVFTLDGVEFATVQNAPYSAKLDPKDHPDLSDGFEHQLAITLIDGSGEKIPQAKPIALAFETREVTKPSPTPEVVQGNTQQPQGGKKTGNVSLLEVQQMSQNLVKQLGGNAQYNISNKQFFQAIQQKTAEYAHDGYFQRASVYRDTINVAYVQERNLPAALGFILAMSRSQFNPAKQGNNEGMWQMTNDFASANGYIGLCGTETLSDTSQKCAATASALYMKAIYYDVFDGDALYSAAAFGKSPAEAGTWKASLPQNRSDVWNSIKTAPEREQLVRFFAAGIVAENPQRFGLANDQPLSVLYKVTM
jgi:hypothetical protein